MLYRKSTSVSIVLVLVAICGSLCPAFTAADGDDDSKKERVTTVYSVEKTSPQTILPVLASIVPNAILTIEAKEKRLIAVATPAEHETIVASLKSFEKVVDVTQIASTRSGPLPKDEIQVRVYATGEKTPGTLIQVLSTATPEAQFAAGEDDKTLIVIAKPAGHEKVSSTLRILQKKPIDVKPRPGGMPGKPPAQTKISRYATVPTRDYSKDEARFEAYATGEMTAEILMRVMRITGSETRVKPGEDGKKLIVFATPAEHEKVRSVMRSLQDVPADAEMVKMQQADARKEQEITELVKECKTATGDEQQAEMRSKLKTAVDEHFAVRQAKRELEVSRLEARLEKIRQSIAKRNEAREQIVDRHISKLLGEADELEF